MPVHNLPSRPTPFIGREQELAEIANLFTNFDCRLLTLTGPGGIGKTRLALEVAKSLHPHFDDGSYFVPLQPLTSPDFIVPAIADALHYTFRGELDPGQQLLGYLGDRHLLLLLDNFEHLLAGVSFISEILTHTSGVKILATCRERLSLQEEWLYPIKGLAFPRASLNGDLESYDAVQLFVRCARRLRPDFSSSDEADSLLYICALLDGMPLGLELAAAWVRALACAEIALEIQRGMGFLETSIRNIEERHRSMRAVLEHSWLLLSNSERDALMKLSVFRGGFTREAAQAAAGATLPILVALVDKSLVKHESAGRYDLHELLRQYAEGKLLDAGEEDKTIQRHCDYFLRLAEKAEVHNFGREQIAWFDRLEEELDNLRATLAWLLESETGLRLAGALGWFFTERSHWNEGFDWLERTIAANPDAPSSLRAKALHAAGVLAWFVGNIPRAQARFEQSLALARETNDRWNIAWALSHLGNLVYQYSDLAHRAALQDESLALFREIDDAMGITHVLIRRAYPAFDQKDYAHTRALLEEAQVRALQAGDKHIIATTTFIMGWLAWHQDRDLIQAKMLIERGLTLYREVRYQAGVNNALIWLGWLELALGNMTEAKKRNQEVLASLRDIAVVHPYLPDVLVVLASIASANDQFERAARLLGAANSLGEIKVRDKDDFDSVIATLRTQLGETAFAEAWAAGKAMTLGQVIAYALEGGGQSTQQDVVSEMGQPASPSQTGPLNNRELEILRLIADGLSNREIAERLFLAVTTVKWYVREILSKLHVNNRTQAVARARTLGMLS